MNYLVPCSYTAPPSGVKCISCRDFCYLLMSVVLRNTVPFPVTTHVRFSSALGLIGRCDILCGCLVVPGPVSTLLQEKLQSGPCDFAQMMRFCGTVTCSTRFQAIWSNSTGFHQDRFSRKRAGALAQSFVHCIVEYVVQLTYIHNTDQLEPNKRLVNGSIRDY